MQPVLTVLTDGTVERDMHYDSKLPRQFEMKLFGESLSISRDGQMVMDYEGFTFVIRVCDPFPTYYAKVPMDVFEGLYSLACSEGSLETRT